MLAALSTGDHHYSTATQVMARMLERRRTPRHQLGRVAAILCGPGAEHSCLVKNFSDGGVRLQSNGFEVPDDFAHNELAQSGRYKVVWRLGNDVGANPKKRAGQPNEKPRPVGDRD